MRPSSDVPVIDIIEMKHGWGFVHTPGMVAVLENFPMPDPEVSIGRVATIRHEDGRALTAEVEGVGRGARSHGVTVRFFFRDLTPTDVPYQP